MYRLALCLLVVMLIFASMPVHAQEDSGKLHCNVFLRPVSFDSFDPNNPLASLNEATVPRPTFGGCYKTQVEAIHIGTEGAISLPNDATQSEVDQAIRQYERALLLSDDASTEAVTRSPAIIAIGYSGRNYQGAAWYYYDPSGYGCTPAGPQNFWFPDYSAQGFPNDDLESIVAYAGCNTINVYEHVSFAGQYIRVDNCVASIYDPYTGVDLNNKVSSSIHLG